LREWCEWNSRGARAANLGLAPLVAAYEQGIVTREGLLAVFKKSYYEWWLEGVIDSEDILRTFSSTEHGRLIGKFRELDEEYLRLAPEIICARLAERAPQTSSIAVPNSEMGILEHERRKKRRHTSIRTLIGKIPTLLPRLKPCLLMSPLSVAQYLDPAFPPFDMVIFDEASQIPPWDAVGALARGKQAIVVGDPKQLPPTTFFSRADEDSQDVEEDLEDLESVLDECLSAQMPRLQLGWHYRSDHESLIHFSNHHYYDDRLLTFPSPAPHDMGVQWRYVDDGIYGRGKDRTNRPEAERVVAEVIRRLKSPHLQDQSIGIVTFSAAQQALVEELLEHARAAQPETERFFSDDEVEEPVFVKNLENVQGDERYIIIFSICYGPDENGSVALNFGPINKVGGERRLNVAITRARRQLLVYSSLRADMISLARTRSKGAIHLKDFLDYAEKGLGSVPAVPIAVDNVPCESVLEEQIHDVLVRRGWRVDKQVGCSGYRIDLAVKHPEFPEIYALGIECDGDNYKRARSARDRDRLRESVLRRLGWDLIRVWSIDWRTDWEREVESIERAIRNAVEKTRDQGCGAADDLDAGEQEKLTLLDTDAPRTNAGVVTATGRGAVGNALTDAQDIKFTYAPMVVRRVFGNQADFDNPAMRSKIPSLLMEIVGAEGPVSFQVTCRRVAAHWGFQKATRHIQDVVRTHIRETGLRLIESADAEFLWPKDIAPETYKAFRVNGPDPEASRKAQEIPLQEFCNGILYLLRTQFGIGFEDLRAATARLFGFQRTGTAIASRIDRAIKHLLATEQAIERNGHIVLPRP